MSTPIRHRSRPAQWGPVLGLFLALSAVSGASLAMPPYRAAATAQAAPAAQDAGKQGAGPLAAAGPAVTESASGGVSASGAAGVITVLSLAFAGLVVIARRNFGKPLERTSGSPVTQKKTQARVDSSVSPQTKRITE